MTLYLRIRAGEGNRASPAERRELRKLYESIATMVSEHRIGWVNPHRIATGRSLYTSFTPACRELDSALRAEQYRTFKTQLGALLKTTQMAFYAATIDQESFGKQAEMAARWRRDQDRFRSVA